MSFCTYLSPLYRPSKGWCDQKNHFKLANLSGGGEKKEGCEGRRVEEPFEEQRPKRGGGRGKEKHSSTLETLASLAQLNIF